MNNSYFVCDAALMKLRVYCTVGIYCYNVEKKLHKNFMPLLTHENACIIYTEVTWRLLFTLGCSWVVRHPFSLVYTSAGTISWIFNGSLSGTSVGRDISKIEEARSHFVGQIATKL